MTIFLLKSCKEEGSILVNRAARSETEDIICEDWLLDSVKLVRIRDRIESLRFVTPHQCSVQLVGARLRDHIKNAAACATEFYAEVAGLYRDFLDRIGDGKHLFLACEPDLVVISPVQHVVVASWTLAVYGEPARV